jgi:hypothetical protein
MAGGFRMVGPPFNVNVEWRLFIYCRLREVPLNAQYIVIGVLVLGFIASIIAYGIWVKKGEMEDAEQAKKTSK